MNPNSVYQKTVNLFKKIGILLKSKWDSMENYSENSFVRIVLSSIFIIFIYFQVWSQIFIFFGVNQTVTDMYMIWLLLFMLFVSILPYKRSVFKIDL